jgi:hypothetical protein
MSALDRILDVLPPTYAVDEGSVVHQVMNALALQLDAYAEDLDRMRRTHWFDLAYRLVDAERLAALVGVERRSWETLPLFRARVRAMVDARLDGSVGPRAIRMYVYETVRGTQGALGGTLIPGLADRIARTAADPRDPLALAAAFESDEARPAWAPLQVIENPPRQARSVALAARGGRVPYLYRWTDTNHGMDPAPASVTVVGRAGGRTAVPVLVNLTTGHALGYAGALRVGQRLTVTPAVDVAPHGRLARAVLDDDLDVTGRVFSLTGFALGRPFDRNQADDPGPLLPMQARGPNDWIYLSGATYDVRGLDNTYFQLADDALREGVFDATNFDQAVFPTGIAATLDVRWTEEEPAAFAVVIPRGVVALPTAAGDLPGEIAEALTADLGEMHAAGVHAQLRLRPFTEVQGQRTKVRLPWVVVPPETGPAGEAVRVGVGGRYDESAFGRSRFE